MKDSNSLLNKSITIRQANVKDCPAISQLCKLHAEFEQSSHITSDHSERLATALSRTPPVIEVFLVEVAGETAGFASITREFFTWDASHFGHMDCLFIKQEFRSLGLGRKMMQHLKEFAFSQGLSHLEWQTPDWNANAIRFYQSIGARAKQKYRFTLGTKS